VKLAIMSGAAVLLVYLACCVAAARLRRLDVGSDSRPFRMPAGAVVPWVAAGMIVWLLAQATARSWLLTGAVVAAASLAFVARREAASTEAPLSPS
jgi:amino acid transporter